MKKQYSWLLLTGALLMAFPVFTRSFFTMSDLVTDFIKGLGVGIILASFFMLVWQSRKYRKHSS